MKKYFAIFAAVAILGMLAIYFVPNEKLASSSVVTSSDTNTTPSTSISTDNATSTTQASTESTSQVTGSYKDGSYTGDSVSTRFGNVKISITVSGGKITNIDFLALPDEDMRSSEISANASPLLWKQTIAAQNAAIDGVSGATYTSNGYIESLQSAIDAAKV